MVGARKAAILIGLLLSAWSARADNLVVRCTSPCLAPDGTLQAAGTIINRIITSVAGNWTPPANTQTVPDTGQTLYSSQGSSSDAPSTQSATVAASATTGVATVTFAPPFKATPTCAPAVVSANASSVFTLTQTAISPTAVSYNVQAALKLLSISLGALTVWGPPPAGTSVSTVCYSATG